jgi:mRNA interferase MazF
VLVVQGEALNLSRIATAICIPLTSNLKWGGAPGNVVLKAKATGLARDSVANVSQIVAIDKDMLTERAGKVQRRHLELVFAGLDLALGR